MNHIKPTRGVLKVDESYDEEHLGITLKMRLFHHQKNFLSACTLLSPQGSQTGSLVAENTCRGVFFGQHNIFKKLNL